MLNRYRTKSSIGGSNPPLSARPKSEPPRKAAFSRLMPKWAYSAYSGFSLQSPGFYTAPSWAVRSAGLSYKIGLYLTRALHPTAVCMERNVSPLPYYVVAILQGRQGLGVRASRSQAGQELHPARGAEWWPPSPGHRSICQCDSDRRARVFARLLGCQARPSPRTAWRALARITSRGSSPGPMGRLACSRQERR